MFVEQFLPWLCFVLSKTYLCEFCFVENMFALIRVRKAHKSYLQSNLFYKYFTFVDIKFVKSAQKKLTIFDGRTSSDGSNIIWLIVSIFLLWFFLSWWIHQLKKMTAALMLWKLTDLKVLISEKVLMSDADDQQKTHH